MTDEAAAVIYLLPAAGPPSRLGRGWRPLGPEPVAAFARAWAEHDPGAPSRLVLVRNGADPSAPDHTAAFAQIPHEVLVLRRPRYDLAAYAAAARVVASRTVCLLNTGSVPVVAGWLEGLTGALDEEGVALAGATASYESVRPRLPYLWRRWPPFPNPHLRSNALVLRAGLLAQVEWPHVRSKHDALRLESGHHSLTRQVLRSGARVVTVGRDRRCYDVDHWFESHTFRSGGQENALVEDNRTRQWAEASPAERDDLARLAWGADPALAADQVRAQLAAAGR